MPAVSKAQGRFFRMVEHNPAIAKKEGVEMTHKQMHDFAATPETGLPQHVKHPINKLKFRGKK